VIAFHEFGHAIAACCTGGRVESISLDPHEGGKNYPEEICETSTDIACSQV
jgi:hypothetical protein